MLFFFEATKENWVDTFFCDFPKHESLVLLPRPAGAFRWLQRYFSWLNTIPLCAHFSWTSNHKFISRQTFPTRIKTDLNNTKTRRLRRNWKTSRVFSSRQTYKSSTRDCLSSVYFEAKEALFFSINDLIKIKVNRKSLPIETTSFASHLWSFSAYKTMYKEELDIGSQQ